MLEQKIQAECLPAPRVSWDERRQSQRQKRVDAVFHQGISQGVSQMCVCVCEKETERERERKRERENLQTLKRPPSLNWHLCVFWNVLRGLGGGQDNTVSISTDTYFYDVFLRVLGNSEDWGSAFDHNITSTSAQTSIESYNGKQKSFFSASS